LADATELRVAEGVDLAAGDREGAFLGDRASATTTIDA